MAISFLKLIIYLFLLKHIEITIQVLLISIHFLARKNLNSNKRNTSAAIYIEFDISMFNLIEMYLLILTNINKRLFSKHSKALDGQQIKIEIILFVSLKRTK